MDSQEKSLENEKNVEVTPTEATANATAVEKVETT